MVNLANTLRWLAASIFYLGDRLIIDEQAGEFDREKAYEVVERIVETAEKASVPILLDMIGGSPKAMGELRRVGGAYRLAFYVDGTTPTVRLAGARKVVELGLQDRCVFNSIGPETNQKEIDALKELDIETCIVMTHNARKPTFKGKFDHRRRSTRNRSPGGFTQFMLTRPSLTWSSPGPCSKTIWLLKDKYGYPAGCSPTILSGIVGSMGASAWPAWLHLGQG